MVNGIGGSNVGEITKYTTLSQILEYPKASDILTKYNLPCLHCPMAAYEMGMLKIGEVAKMYDIDVESLLRELNGACCVKSNPRRKRGVKV